MANGDTTANKVVMTVLGIGVTIALAAFGSMEVRKVDKSAFDIHCKNDSETRLRIEATLCRIERKIDNVYEKED